MACFLRINPITSYASFNPVLTYLPLSQRAGHTASTRAITAHRAWTWVQRFENAIIDRVDLDRKRAAELKLAAMPAVGRVS